MGNNATNKVVLVTPQMVDTESNFYAVRGYTNAYVYRTKAIANSQGDQEIHDIIAGSNYFSGDSTYRKAPIGSRGTNKAGGSSTTLYLKTTSSKWQGVCNASGTATSGSNAPD